MRKPEADTALEEFPAALLAACKKLHMDPATVRAFRLRPEGVTLINARGQKLKVPSDQMAQEAEPEANPATKVKSAPGQASKTNRSRPSAPSKRKR